MGDGVDTPQTVMTTRAPAVLTRPTRARDTPDNREDDAVSGTGP